MGCDGMGQSNSALVGVSGGEDRSQLAGRLAMRQWRPDRQRAPAGSPAQEE